MALSDFEYMNQALCLALRGRGRTSPNPIVGAIVVSDGVVVGSGYHQEAGSPHAEVHALSAAGSAAKGATLFCTLEPCCHTGHTGPCVEQIVEFGVRRVVVAVEDPNPLVAGGGISFLRGQGVQVEVGLCGREAFQVNRDFFTFIRYNRPFVTMKIALSIDGYTTSQEGSRATITSTTANRHAHLLRAEVDAIGVGSGTIVTDDPLLTAREVHRRRPLTRVIFDTRLRTPPTARIFSTLDHGPVIIVTTTKVVDSRARNVEMLVKAGAKIECLESCKIKMALGRMGELGIMSLLLEGGTTIHRAAWAADVVDRVQMYLSPTSLGSQGLSWLTSQEVSLSTLTNVSVKPCGEDMFMEGYVHRID